MFGSVWDLLYLVGVGHATVRALNGMHDPLTTATTTPPTGALKGEWTEFIADSVHAAAHSTRPGSMLQKHVLPRCGVAPSGADGGAHPGVCPFSMWSEPAYFAGWGATPEPIVRATSSAFSVRSSRATPSAPPALAPAGRCCWLPSPWACCGKRWSSPAPCATTWPRATTSPASCSSSEARAPHPRGS
eukprot:TRINITY_DN3495_c0_g2_i2.p1 TRINITY_DN3495_c0_g2~~TRINITY_DN3495_c0_g2_i2.p1  ORF type:complete len:188 (+),score=16.26 TRINITY_DN3495_c0_g2_i2:144-707(+)